jgi:hypothetical protein
MSFEFISPQLKTHPFIVDEIVNDRGEKVKRLEKNKGGENSYSLPLSSWLGILSTPCYNQTR